MKLLAVSALLVFTATATFAQGNKAFDLSPLDEVCPTDGPVYFVPHPVYCQFYYICSEGKPILMECPTGLYFNPLRSGCDFPENVEDCGGGTRPPVGPTTTGTPPTTPSTGTTSTTEGSPVTEPTGPPPTTTEGTPATEPTATSTAGPSTTGLPGVPQCPAGVLAIFVPYPGDCTRYGYCENGVLIRILNCNANLWFQQAGQVCRTPWDTVCPN